MLNRLDGPPGITETRLLHSAYVVFNISQEIWQSLPGRYSLLGIVAVYIRTVFLSWRTQPTVIPASSIAHCRLSVYATCSRFCPTNTSPWGHWFFPFHPSPLCCLTLPTIAWPPSFTCTYCTVTFCSPPDLCLFTLTAAWDAWIEAKRTNRIFFSCPLTRQLGAEANPIGAAGWPQVSGDTAMMQSSSFFESKARGRSACRAEGVALSGNFKTITLFHVGWSLASSPCQQARMSSCYR